MAAELRVEDAVAIVTRRRIVAEALACLPKSALAAALPLAAVAAAWHVGAIDSHVRTASLVAALLVAFGVPVVVGLARRTTALAAAITIDDTHGTGGAIAAALEFAKAPAPSPFVSITLEDAARALGAFDARLAAPIDAKPRSYGAALVALLIPATLLWIAPRTLAATMQPVATQPPPDDARESAVVDRDALAAMREDLPQERASRNDTLERVRARLAKLTGDLAEGSVSTREALATLRELDATLAEERTQHEASRSRPTEHSAARTPQETADDERDRRALAQQVEMLRELLRRERERGEGSQADDRRGDGQSERQRPGTGGENAEDDGEQGGERREGQNGQSGRGRRPERGEGRSETSSQEGRGGSRAERMRAFQERAQGASSGEGAGDGAAPSEGSAEGEGTSGEPGSQAGGDKPGPGAGSQVGGEGTPEGRLATTPRDERAEGSDRGGPTRSEVISGGAERGFRGGAYRRVYDEYENHAERVLERDEIPGGYRYYVRRYFQLIRPRED